MPTKIEMVMEYMVKNSVDGVFRGTPRKYMEQIGASSGPLYTKLKDAGFEQVGTGKNAQWVIPKKILLDFKK